MQAQLTSHQDRSNPHTKMHCMAWAAASSSSSSSNRSRQQLTQLGYKRRPLHLLLVYLQCTSEVALRQAKCTRDYI